MSEHLNICNVALNNGQGGSQIRTEWLSIVGILTNYVLSILYIDSDTALSIGFPLALNDLLIPFNANMRSIISFLNSEPRSELSRIRHNSDRGCHYRWPGWIERINQAGLTRSMSKKGCSPDNAACEGFFGRLKVEMFYGYSWNDVTIE